MNWADATHIVIYAHCVGQSCKRYAVRCHVLKEMPDGKRLKIRAFGNMWKGSEDVTRVAYVDKGRVQPIARDQRHDQ